MILSIIFTITILGLVSFFVISAFLNIRRQTNKYKAATKFSKFYNQLIEYSDEITDLNIRSEYIIFLMSIPLSYEETNTESYYESLIDKYKIEISDKFSNYIPSLKKEIRDTKLEKLLK